MGVSEGDGEAESADKELGVNPATGRAVWLKNGRFGPYVEELAAEGDKPKRSSLPKGWIASAMDLEKALRLLSLPREVGKHPDDGKVITAGLGRFGPFVLHDGTYANLENADEVFDVGLNRAVAILADKRAGGGRPQRAAAAALAELGNHPEDGKPIRVLSGRFGPYIKHGDTNANVPKGKDPAAITLEEALALIAERAAKGGGKKPAKKAAAPKKAATKAEGDKPAKKTAAKKPAAKKAAPKAKAKAEAASSDDGAAPWDDEA
ncbi:topoisomerase C-terminal repeat-containing protein [Caulobacter sp. BP25]|uniref:topoisomerase C-terminal repeat-containing protein n=1 Tax=Caulobacter sp. BP25 TaxID=2048900 RepID=UPI0035143DA2